MSDKIAARFNDHTTVAIHPPKALARAEALIKKHSLSLVLATAALSYVVPSAGLAVRGAQLGTVPITGWKYDALTLALSLIMLSASVNFQPHDLVTVARSRAKGPLLGSVYLLGAGLALVVANATLLLLAPEVSQPLSLGLILIGLMPVAMTSAAWVRMNTGNVPLLLGAIVLTNTVAVPTVPWILRRIAGGSNGAVGDAMQVGPVVAQLTLAILVPVAVGMIARAVVPLFVRKIQPLLSILSMAGLLASLGSTVASSRPQIEAHAGAIAQAGALTLLLNVAFFVGAVTLTRSAKLEREDTITLLFATGMRNMGAAMVVAAIAFPDAPLVAIPAAVFSISQQLVSGLATSVLVARPELTDPTFEVPTGHDSHGSIPSIHPPPA